MAAAFCIRLLDPGAAGGDPGAAGCQQGAQPWQRLLAGRTACAILPLQGMVLEDCAAPWVFLRRFSVREALQFSSFRAWRHLSPREPRLKAAIGITHLEPFFPG